MTSPVVSGISAATDAALRERSEQFRRYTQQKGRPMVYGHGDPPAKKAKKKR